MKNFCWRYTELQATELPAKAQRFISIMNLDVSRLRFVRLEKDPDGIYLQRFGSECEGAAAVYSQEYPKGNPKWPGEQI